MFKRITVVVVALACLLPVAVAAAPDLIRTALEESRTSGKGLNFFVNGQAIPGVVVRVDDTYVVARSQSVGTIVLRLDRIDGVGGFIVTLGSDKKAP